MRIDVNTHVVTDKTAWAYTTVVMSYSCECLGRDKPTEPARLSI